MIKYPHKRFHFVQLFQLHGSAFIFTLPISLACAFISAGMQSLTTEDAGDAVWFFSNIISNPAAYTSVTFLCGFLIVFRTQLSYNRFWEGAQSLKAMEAEFFVTASNLVAFCRHSSAEASLVADFQHKLVRFLSLLHAVGLAQLHSEHGDDTLYDFEFIDPQGLDKDSLALIQLEECRVELLLQWIQSLVVDGIKTGVCSIPPPILSRIFQNLANGLSAFHSASIVHEIPYPFPYMQTTEMLLVTHFLLTPMVMCVLTNTPLWAGVFSFCASFSLWSLNTIATELEHPFGKDPNDLPMIEMQSNLNKRLLLLLRPSTNCVPVLSQTCIFRERKNASGESNMVFGQDAWDSIDRKASEVIANFVRTHTRQRSGVDASETQESIDDRNKSCFHLLPECSFGPPEMDDPEQGLYKPASPQTIGAKSAFKKMETTPSLAPSSGTQREKKLAEWKQRRKHAGTVSAKSKTPLAKELGQPMKKKEGLVVEMSNE